MNRQRQKTGGRFHDRRAIESAILSGNSASSTMGSGRRLNVIRTRANTARPITNGRGGGGRKSRNPLGIRRPPRSRKPRRGHGEPVAPAHSGGKARQAPNPTLQGSTCNRGERPRRAAQFRAGADG